MAAASRPAAVVVRGGGYVADEFRPSPRPYPVQPARWRQQNRAAARARPRLGHVRDGHHRPWQHVRRGRVLQQSHRSTGSSRSSDARPTSRPASAPIASQVPKGDDFDGGGNFHLILLAESRIGYRNLCRLLSAAYQEGLYYKPRIDKEILTELNEGLIALSGCLSGEVARCACARTASTRRARRRKVTRTFSTDRFYLELQDNRLHAPLNDALREIGRTAGLPLVATNDCHYLHRDDARAHEVLLCIQTGKTLADESRWRFDTDELYVKTPDGDGHGVRRRLRGVPQHDRDRAAGRFRVRVRQVPLPDLPGRAAGRPRPGARSARDGGARSAPR